MPALHPGYDLDERPDLFEYADLACLTCRNRVTRLDADGLCPPCAQDPVTRLLM